MSRYVPPELDLLLTTDEAVRRQALEDAELREWSTREARRRLDAAERPTAPPFDAGLLGEVLDREPEPPFRVEGLIPADAYTLVVAQMKAGKTTLTLNLTRSLLTGEPFLGRFDTRPVGGRVAFLNFEVTASMLASWAMHAGIDRDRMLLVNLRGRRNPFGNDEDRDSLAELLRAHEVESIIVDPFSRAFSGESQNDAQDVTAWTSDLHRWASVDVGATDLVLTAHSGWDGGRVRGSTALQDGPDSIITLTRGEQKGAEHLRFLRAEGRDVLVDKDLLAFDPITMRLTMTGAGAPRMVSAADRMSKLTAAVVDVVAAEPGINATNLEERLKAQGHPMQKGDASKAAANAVDQLLLHVEPAPRGGKRYFSLASPTDRGASHATSPDVPRGYLSGTVPVPPYIGGTTHSGEVKAGELTEGLTLSPGAADNATRWAPLLPVPPGGDR